MPTIRLIGLIVSFLILQVYSFKLFHARVRRNHHQKDATTIDGENFILKQIDDWACIRNCGACCKLGPLSSRPDIKDYLAEDQYNLYVSMIGEDNWCKHFDKKQRICTIYEDRPSFCRVEVENFQKMYDIEKDEFTVSILKKLKNDGFQFSIIFRIFAHFVVLKTFVIFMDLNQKK
jgi:uncharacterized protein